MSLLANITNIKNVLNKLSDSLYHERAKIRKLSDYDLRNFIPIYSGNVFRESDVCTLITDLTVLINTLEGEYLRYGKRINNEKASRPDTISNSPDKEFIKTNLHKHTW